VEYIKIGGIIRRKKVHQGKLWEIEMIFMHYYKSYLVHQGKWSKFKRENQSSKKKDWETNQIIIETIVKMVMFIQTWEGIRRIKKL